jgi:tight adherence protein C
MDPTAVAGRRVMPPLALPPALAFVAVTLGAAAVAVRVDANLIARLEIARSPRPRRATDRWVGSLGSRAWLRRLSRVEVLSSHLDAAGSTVAVETIVVGKLALGFAGCVLGLLTPMPGPLLAPVLAVAAFRCPDLVLRQASTRRLREADREVPLLLDLLAAAASSGLSGQLALGAVVGAVEGPLADELARALRAVDLGVRWRDELQAVAERLGLQDLRRAIGVLARSDALGSSLVESLGTIAKDAREARRAATTERARKAPVKMLFPLVFLVLPAFLLLTVVPVLLTTVQSIR